MPRTRKTHAAKSPNASQPGSLVIIGGGEDRKGDKDILNQIVRLGGKGKLVIVSAASEIPGELFKEYREIFRGMGVKQIEHLSVESPEDARKAHALEVLAHAAIVFFTGGDQLRVTSKMGGTPALERILEIHRRGGVIAGTSAGASIMGETMLVGGESQESHKIGNWMMAPGIGLMNETIIDQHFAQRGRIGRLLGAVALNPGVLGIGLDEDTAIVVSGGGFSVYGSNAAYVIDGRDVTYSNIAESDAERTMSMHDVRLHILSRGESFDLNTRRPIPSTSSEAHGAHLASTHA